MPSYNLANYRQDNPLPVLIPRHLHYVHVSNSHWSPQPRKRESSPSCRLSVMSNTPVTNPVGVDIRRHAQTFKQRHQQQLRIPSPDSAPTRLQSSTNRSKIQLHHTLLLLFVNFNDDHSDATLSIFTRASFSFNDIAHVWAASNALSRSYNFETSSFYAVTKLLNDNNFSSMPFRFVFFYH